MTTGNNKTSGPGDNRLPLAEDNCLESLTVKIRPDLYRAFHRCSWIIIHETGRSQLDIMQEMVEDFLMKHGC
ncbi:MAG: hypothetical protein M0P70_10045 [Desulfobulbaceae bacterium]|nr:hypothetical protein [Desulfobulbaceae bacterium]